MGDEPKGKDYNDAATDEGKIGLYRWRRRQISPAQAMNRVGNSRMVGAHEDPVVSDNPSSAVQRKGSITLSRRSHIEHTQQLGNIAWDKNALINWSSNQ